MIIIGWLKDDWEMGYGYDSAPKTMEKGCTKRIKRKSTDVIYSHTEQKACTEESINISSKSYSIAIAYCI